MTAVKCVHKGCGKVFTEPSEEECIYHPGPPIFHEGQKGWRCCKPRVLTFDEFLSIPPCTKGKHSAVEDTPPPVAAATKAAGDGESASSVSSIAAPPPRNPVYQPQIQQQQYPSQPATPTPEESDHDDPSLAIPPNTPCRRRGCKALSTPPPRSSDETCVFHPGHPLFHEGSKGYTCCKRRVLEFDEFLRIEGCQTKDRHLFIGSGKKKRGDNSSIATSTAADSSADAEEHLSTVRHDFYQTSTTLTLSLYLKKISPQHSTITFPTPLSIYLDLLTTDKKRYTATIPLYAPIEPEKCEFKILGTKAEVLLVKADGISWPVLRSDERVGGEIYQVGRAGMAV